MTQAHRTYQIEKLVAEQLPPDVMATFLAELSEIDVTQKGKLIVGGYHRVTGLLVEFLSTPVQTLRRRGDSGPVTPEETANRS